MYLKSLNQLGDTIVEVLIAITVASFVLGGAFVSSNRSAQSVQKSQERVEALKVVESQIETLRAASSTNLPVNIFTNASPFCIDSAGALGASVPCDFGPDGRYKVTVTRDADNMTFRVEAKWDSIGGKNVETIQVVYRLRQ